MLDPKLSPPDEGLIRADKAAAGWAVSQGLIPYERAVEIMEARVGAIAQGEAQELVWLVEHPPLYTAGVSAKPHDLLQPDRFPVHATGRGGQFTYHGPGQRVCYVMLDLTARKRDIRAFVSALESCVIVALQAFNVKGEIRPGRVGVWVPLRNTGGQTDEAKIAAIGVKVRRWVTFHGLSLNVEPDLEHFKGIVPCGISEHGVTSLVDLGLPVTMDEADHALRRSFEAAFGPLKTVAPPL